MQWYDVLRLITTLFSLLCLYCLFRIIHRGNLTQDRVSRDLWWSVTIMVFAVGAGSLEQVIRDRGITWVIPISTLTMIVFYQAIRKTRQRVESARAAGTTWYIPS